MTPFSAPIPAVLHLDFLGFKQEKDENMSFITSIKDFLSFRKNVASSVYAVHQKVWLNMLRSFIFLFSLIHKKLLLELE